MEDSVVHKKDVFAESSKARSHTLFGGTAITFPFSVCPLAATRAVNSSLLRFFQLSNPDSRSAELCRRQPSVWTISDDFETSSRNSQKGFRYGMSSTLMESLDMLSFL